MEEEKKEDVVKKMETGATNPLGEPPTVKAKPVLRAETKNEEIDLPLADIQRVEKFLVRLKRNEPKVKEYAELFTDYKEEIARNKKAKYPFPPITVWYDEHGRCVLLAGDHRSAAALMAGMVTIRAKVFHGTEQEAYVFAYKDNAENALPMGRGDKKYAITKALLMFPDKSLDYFVQELKCGKTTVSELRTELYKTGKLVRPEGVVGKDGKTYTLPQQSGNQSSEDAPKKSTQPEQALASGDAALTPPIEEPKVPEKSEIERVREFIAMFESFEQTLTNPDMLYGWMDGRLRQRKDKKRIEQTKTVAKKVDAVNAEVIMPTQQLG